MSILSVYKKNEGFKNVLKKEAGDKFSGCVISFLSRVQEGKTKHVTKQKYAKAYCSIFNIEYVEENLNSYIGIND